MNPFQKFLMLLAAALFWFYAQIIVDSHNPNSVFHTEETDDYR